MNHGPSIHHLIFSPPKRSISLLLCAYTHPPTFCLFWTSPGTRTTIYEFTCSQQFKLHSIVDCTVSFSTKPCCVGRVEGLGLDGGGAYIRTDARLSALSSTGGAQIAVSEIRAGQENPFLLILCTTKPQVKMCCSQCIEWK